MFRYQVFKESKLYQWMQHQKVCFSISYTDLRKKKNDNGSKKTVLENLLDELSNTRKEDELEIFLQKTKPQKVTNDAFIKTENKHNKDKKNTVDKTNHSIQGEKFWFDSKDDKITFIKPTVKVHVSVTQSQSVNLDGEAKLLASSVAELNEKLTKKMSKAPLTPLEIESLQDELKQQGNERHISQLLNAMMDQINVEKVDPEKKFQELMKIINAKHPFIERETAYQLEEGSQPTKNQPQRIVSFISGESTMLFSNMQFSLEKAKKYHSFSLFEKQNKEELMSLLPEHLPQNAFEAAMLNIDQQWNFPIDNEQDMGVEDETTFDQHVFLDQLLSQNEKIYIYI